MGEQDLAERIEGLDDIQPIHQQDGGCGLVDKRGMTSIDQGRDLEEDVPLGVTAEELADTIPVEEVEKAPRPAGPSKRSAKLPEEKPSASSARSRKGGAGPAEGEPPPAKKGKPKK